MNIGLEHAVNTCDGPQKLRSSFFLHHLITIISSIRQEEKRRAVVKKPLGRRADFGACVYQPRAYHVDSPLPQSSMNFYCAIIAQVLCT